MRHPLQQPVSAFGKGKFFILLHEYKKRHGPDALAALIDENGLDRARKVSDDHESIGYTITCRDIEDLYNRVSPVLTNEDKLEIIAQAVYEKYKGLGVIDEIRDMNIDGVSAGVSGVTDAAFYGPSFYNSSEPAKKLPRSHESVWIFFRGKSIKLDFWVSRTRRNCAGCARTSIANRGGQLSEATTE